ncbi:hypothetical protein D3C86_1534840 [compost metagenome]
MTSFSGSDLIVTVGPKTIGELQQISWAIQREKAPVYTFGSPDARSFSRGKRGIAGSLVFATFNRDALLEALKEIWHQIAPKAMFTAAGNIAVQGSEDFKNALDLAAWNQASGNTTPAGTGFSGTTQVGWNAAHGSDNKWDPATGTWLQSQSKVAQPPGFGLMRGDNILYADQVPPFDITMTFANEYGQAAFQKIYDVDILNEGSGVSVDTIVMERQMTYVARRISPIMAGVYSREVGGQVNAIAVDQGQY